MTKERYMGIENELMSFSNRLKNKRVRFSANALKKIYQGTTHIKDRGYDQVIWSDTGNMYYQDIPEIEISTPPIPLNKGFASRLTDMLIIGRDRVVSQTPHLKHTGYSMHWNVTKTDTHMAQFNDEILIPFQLFGLTPLSRGTCIKDKERRFELAGDSLTSEDQINATALLLGSYSLASERYNFPLTIKDIQKIIKPGPAYETSLKAPHLLTNGRHTVFTVKDTGWFSKHRETQVQNIVELFYEWLSPFVHKLGTDKEVGNLEAFIKGEKNLEMDELKYFYMLAKEHDQSQPKSASHSFRISSFNGTYKPLHIETSYGTRSPILVAEHNKELPLESRLWKESMSRKKFKRNYADWANIEVVHDRNKIHNPTIKISGIDEIYRVLELISGIQYKGTIDYHSIRPKRILRHINSRRLNERTCYNPINDTSAKVNNMDEFAAYLSSKGYIENNSTYQSNTSNNESKEPIKEQILESK